MKSLIVIALATFHASFTSFAQESSGSREPVFMVGVSFHAVSTPFSKPGNNFRNVGFKLGMELPWNKRDNLRQGLEVGFYANKFNGRSLYIHSDLIYRPKISEGLRATIQLGPGLGYLSHPKQVMKRETDQWISTTSAKIFGQVHTSVGLSYDDVRFIHATASPFVQYEVVGIVGYNPGLPVLPNSLIHIGSKLKF